MRAGKKKESTHTDTLKEYCIDYTCTHSMFVILLYVILGLLSVVCCPVVLCYPFGKTRTDREREKREPAKRRKGGKGGDKTGNKDRKDRREKDKRWEGGRSKRAVKKRRANSTTKEIDYGRFFCGVYVRVCVCGCGGKGIIM